jgi:hypothetical protein
MSTNTLQTAYTNGQVIDASHVNELTLSLLGDMVGRNSSGVPTTGQNLGTVAIPWGSVYANQMVLAGQAIDTSQIVAPQNRIVSGAVRSTANQPQFLTPNGAAASFLLEGATTNLVLDVNGVAVTVNTDITKSGLTVGPSTTATCLVNDTDAADQISTRTWGEKYAEKESITVDNMGAEFQAFIGQFVIIEITGVATEYAIAFVKSATELTNIYRGYFTNSAGTPINRTAFFDNDVITVLSTAWVFVEDNGTTVDVTYTTPVSSFTAPGSPATGDYWEDLGNRTWKRYDGASFQIIDRTLVGVVGIDSANCVCARSFDFYAKHADTNTAELTLQSTEIAEIKDPNSKASILGNEYNFGYGLESWNITTDLAASADMYTGTEQSSTVYYLYLLDTGETTISDIEPQWRPDLLGHYHPHLPARCMAIAYNDSSSDLTLIDDMKYNLLRVPKVATFRDDKTQNTAGGGFTAGAWQQRTINVFKSGTEFGSLAANIITLLPGTYRCKVDGVHHIVQNNQLRLFDNTTSLEVFSGLQVDDNGGTGGINTMYEEFTIATTVHAIQVEHRCNTSRPTDGFGDAGNFNVETYLTGWLEKVA